MVRGARHLHALKPGDALHMPYMIPHWVSTGDELFDFHGHDLEDAGSDAAQQDPADEWHAAPLRPAAEAAGRFAGAGCAKVMAHDAMRAVIDPLRKSEADAADAAWPDLWPQGQLLLRDQGREGRDVGRPAQAAFETRNGREFPAIRIRKSDRVSGCDLVGRGVVVAEIVGDRLVGDLADGDVEAVAQMRVVGQRLLPALVGDGQREGQGDVVERIGRGAGDAARHVGDAVVDDAVDHIGRVGMGGGLRGFGAAALVDGDVDEDRAGLPVLQHGAW